MPVIKKDSAVSPVSAKPANLAAAQATPGTSTSTGGATATRNTGAATGGAVTITISGSSSTGTSTETSTETGGAGKGSAAGGKGKGGAGKGKGSGSGPDTGDKRPHVYNITVNSTGKSGDAIDGDRGDQTHGAGTPPAKKAKAFRKGTSGLNSAGKKAQAVA
jgi:hypothetical protein